MDQRPDDTPYQEWFCSSCNTLLFRVVPAPGMRIMLRCRRCGAIIEHQVGYPPKKNGVDETTEEQVVHLFHRLDDKLDSVLNRIAAEG